MRRRTDSIVKEIRRLQVALKVARHSLALISGHVVATRGNPRGNGRTRARLSAKAHTSQVLQGRYIGYLRHLKPRQKAQVRKIREAKGVRAAIARARRLGR